MTYTEGDWEGQGNTCFLAESRDSVSGGARGNAPNTTKSAQLSANIHFRRIPANFSGPAALAGAFDIAYNIGDMLNDRICSNNRELCGKLFSSHRLLFIGAHPDDIEFYCGGLAYMLRRSGVDVSFVIATRGGRGLSGSARTRLEKLRTRNAVDAAKMLGVNNVSFLNYPDKDLSSHIEQLASDLQKLISANKPDIVLSWDPDFIYNPHPDHKAAAQAANIATKDLSVCYYGTKQPNLRVSLDNNAFRAKIASLRAHRTETPWYYWYPILRWNVLNRLKRGARGLDTKYAEVLRFR